MNKKINAKAIFLSAAMFTAVLMAGSFTEDAHAAEAAFYTPQTSDQTSEPVKRTEAAVTDVPNAVTDQAVTPEAVTAAENNTDNSQGTENPGVGDATPAPTARPAATPTPAPTTRPTVVPTTVPTATPAPVHVHSYTGTVTKAATCTTNGVMTYTCSCGDSYTQPIAATGHNYVPTGSTAATCTTNGSITYTCSNCGGTKSDTVLATGHVWVPLTQDVWIVDQAAWDEPVTTYVQELHNICNVCGFDYTAAGLNPSFDFEHENAHMAAMEGGGFHDEVVQIPVTTYVHHDAVGHTETQVIGQVCSVCGATQ